MTLFRKYSRMEIAMISNIITGASSDVFSRSSTCLDFASFTLMTKNRERNLDLEVQHADVSTEHGAEIIKEERNAWVEAFEDLPNSVAYVTMIQMWRKKVGKICIVE